MIALKLAPCLIALVSLMLVPAYALPLKEKDVSANGEGDSIISKDTKPLVFDSANLAKPFVKNDEKVGQVNAEQLQAPAAQQIDQDQKVESSPEGKPVTNRKHDIDGTLKLNEARDNPTTSNKGLESEPAAEKLNDHQQQLDSRNCDNKCSEARTYKILFYVLLALFILNCCCCGGGGFYLHRHHH